MILRIACTVAFLATILASLPADGQVTLARKVLEGRTSTLETNSKTEQKLTIAGMENDTNSEAHVTAKITTGQRDAGGNLKVEEKITAMQIQIKAQGSEYLFDSANPDKSGTSGLEVLRKVHQVQARRKTTRTLDKENKVVAIDYDENALDGLDDNLKNLVKEQFDVEKIKKTENDETARIPATPIAKGDSWEHTSRANLGAGQVLSSKTRYTYEGLIEKGNMNFDRITLKVLSVEYTLEDSPLPLALKSSKLEPVESKGELLFDRALGEVAESSLQMNIKGDIVFTVNDMELPSKLDLKMEVSSMRKE